ncbi:MAG: hypothetical protein EP343_04950 [Deltaproteobacteria bacterium]|nr:MAG: hypothetical protein EP343_04950 [Deltaproteobacteria bacterium]
MKRAIGWIVCCAVGLFAMQALADVGPPPGKKRIPIRYHFKKPTPSPYTYLVILTSGMRPARIELSPIVWDKTFAPPRGYRTRAQLVALTQKQVVQLVELLAATKEFKKDAVKLKAMDGKAKAAWLEKVTWEAERRGKPGAIRLFFKNNPIATSDVLYTRTVVATSSPATFLLKSYQVGGVEKNNVILKEVKEEKRNKANKKVTKTQEGVALLKARWPWAVGVVVLVFALVVAFRRK